MEHHETSETRATSIHVADSEEIVFRVRKLCATWIVDAAVYDYDGWLGADGAVFFLPSP